ncbi:hypothetical protein [Rubrivivax benzoatilyticus]|uniref:Uncharacterized protein n=1 Tax=Rubrivivax benzoatilyticus TaxID=316997 RepID=A0ABX0HXT2_9BURK|nr:hypothetical protein [Rubrivivax benzoatilyticus]EGJ10282.1 hypothetical protein RBXJA2T_08148 [Rubrivivax benzoatilyticus JA2 = ATCC BAA-35]NHK99797.1 hypothetical protein [Rubrivivax benzoatilyticus]NHL25670.1 hypothetical protein [Rubrivivax benzoatilyticus]
MDWFQRLTGFAEPAADELRRRLHWRDGRLHAPETGRSWAVGELELVTLGTLRERAAALPPAPPPRCRVVQGDVRALHRDPALAGALFQVASQFNLLEMIGPQVTPDDGVTRYEHDRTQGPACAMACGAATLVRHYFVPVDGRPGQTAGRQLDALAGLGEALAAATGRPREALWEMRNGYALPSADGLTAIDAHLAALDEAGLDTLRTRLAIGVHRDVEVTDVTAPPGPVVSQAFCSALPVAYSRHRGAPWARFATLVLEAAYEATLWEARLAAAAGKPPQVLLTQLGGGAFGNDEAWIGAAMRRAFASPAAAGLELHLVSYGPPSKMLLELADEVG